MEDHSSKDPLIDVLPPQKTNMRDNVIAVFEKLDGVDGMLAWVQESTVNRRIFYKDILPKVIPREAQITGEGGGPVRMEVKWSRDEELDLRNKLIGTSPALVALSSIKKAVNDDDD
jgi:hypothetical protein